MEKEKKSKKIVGSIINMIDEFIKLVELADGCDCKAEFYYGEIRNKKDVPGFIRHFHQSERFRYEKEINELLSEGNILFGLGDFIRTRREGNYYHYDTFIRSLETIEAQIIHIRNLSHKDGTEEEQIIIKRRMKGAT